MSKDIINTEGQNEISESDRVSDINFAWYSTVKSTMSEETSFLKEMNRIKNGYYKPIVNTARAILENDESKKDYREYRERNVPGIIVGLKTTGKTKDEYNPEDATCLLVIDVDDEDEDPDLNKEILLSLPYVVAVGKSVGGRNLFAIAKCDPKKHKESHASLIQILKEKGVTVARGQTNPNRLRYVSDDPDLYFNPCPLLAPEVPIVEVEEKEKKIIAEEIDPSFVSENFENTYNQIVEGKIDITCDYPNWLNTGFALVNEFGEAGRKYFHGLSQFNSKYDYDDTDAKYTSLLKSEKYGITIKTFFFLAKQAGIQIKAKTLAEEIHAGNPWAKELLRDIPVKPSNNGKTIKETYLDKFRRSILDQTKEYPLPEAVIYIIQNSEKIPLLTLKSFSLWQGKQKSRKTTLLALAVSEFIRPSVYNSGIHFQGAITGKVLYFDNEQGTSYAARTMKLILKLIEQRTSSNLIYSDLREFPPYERVKIIQAAIESIEGVKLVIIDGLVDLMTDFMDPAEGHLCITNIIKLCSVYNIHVAGVLHQNKADKNARAHVGSISSQKCEIEISTEKDPQDRTQSLVTCVNSRGLPFDPFVIKWEKGSLPQIVQDWVEVDLKTKSRVNKKEIENEGAYELAKKVFIREFMPGENLKSKLIVQRIMKNEKIQFDAANKRLKTYKGWGFFTDQGKAIYRVNDPNKQLQNLDNVLDFEENEED